MWSRKRTRLIRITASFPSSDAENGWRQSPGPSASSAQAETLNNHISLPAQDLRTVGADADANADATGVGQTSTVRSNPLNRLDTDDADGVDANCPASSEQEGNIASQRWSEQI